MQLKYIIDNKLTKQFGGSFDIDDDKKIHLKLVVSKKLDDHFCTVLDNLHAKEGTEITLVDNNEFIDESINSLLSTFLNRLNKSIQLCSA